MTEACYANQVFSKIVLTVKLINSLKIVHFTIECQSGVLQFSRKINFHVSRLQLLDSDASYRNKFRLAIRQHVSISCSKQHTYCEIEIVGNIKRFAFLLPKAVCMCAIASLFWSRAIFAFHGFLNMKGVESQYEWQMWTKGLLA